MVSIPLHRELKIIHLEVIMVNIQGTQKFVVSHPSDIYAVLNYNYTHANITHHFKSLYYLAVLISRRLNLSPQSKYKCADL